MKTRIPLEIAENRVVLNAVMESKGLRIAHRFIRFVLDTGSPYSFLSEKEVLRLQIPIKDRVIAGEVDFGGSRFNRVELPPVILHLLLEDKIRYTSFDVHLKALKTTKQSPEKRRTAQALPSVLGMDFLTEQKLSLHLFPSEKIAYLESESL